MKKLLLPFLSFCFVLGVKPLLSQSPKTIETDVQITYAEHLGTTPPIRELVPAKFTSDEKRKILKDNRKMPPNFIGRGKRGEPKPGALPMGPDRLWQKSFNRTLTDPPTIVANIEGLNSNSVPQDPTGEAGIDFYMQAVNSTQIAVFDKEGNLIAEPFAANTIWNSIGASSFTDPIILFDQEVNRWIITEVGQSFDMLIAVSKTSDPLGEWDAYRFNTPGFPDYPKYSIWSNAYVITTNEGGAGVLPAYFLDRTAMLNGDDNVMIQRVELPGVPDGPGFTVATPADWTGPIAPPTGADPIILRINDDAWGSVENDQIEVFNIEVDFDDPDNTTVTSEVIISAPFDTNPCSVSGPGFACVPQLDGNGLDGLPEIIMFQVLYRNFTTHEAIVLNFITDVTGGENLSGIRWMELRRSPGGNWTLYQEGTFSPDDGMDRYNGAIAMNGTGDIALAYAISSEESYVGLRFTGRKKLDPLGIMTIEECVIVDGTNTINSFGRFGDYAHMVVDPEDDRTFWFTGEYGGGGNNGASTRIIGFRISRDSIDLATTALVAPMSGSNLAANETVTIQYINAGIDTIDQFQVGFIFENEPAVVENVNFTLAPDSSYEHTFATTVDLSLVGFYEFKAFGIVDGDTAPLNDTIRVVVQNRPMFDIGVTDLGELPISICGTEIMTSVNLLNFGTETINSATVNFSINGIPADPVNWTGELLPGESTAVQINLSGLISGSNEVVVTSALPNGMSDEVPQNDGITRNINAISNAVSVFVEIRVDEYPEETTWTITDANDNVLFSGGPYADVEDNSTVIEEICLDPEGCYTFNIFDSFGDGICCDYGNGNYQLTDAEGHILIFGDGMFGVEESMDFCATFTCLLEAMADTSPASEPGAEDGVIIITGANGIQPYEYSIDGGNTFQNTNFFEGLEGGTYTIVIRDANCEYTTTITVATCELEISATVTDESGPAANDGSISIAAMNGTPPYEYSIDGGGTFLDLADFEGLPAGSYDLVVRDAMGCERTLEVIVDMMVSTNQQIFGQRIEIFPNPTSGVFQINLHGVQQKGNVLGLEVYNSAGLLIQRAKLSKYDDTYTGTISITVQPAGLYYIRFIDPEINRIVRVVKE